MKQLSIAHLDNNRSALEQHKKLMNHMMQQKAEAARLEAQRAAEAARNRAEA